MRAAIYRGKEALDVEEVDDPIIADGEVLLEIEACAVCGTDLRTYRHGDQKIKPLQSPRNGFDDILAGTM